MKSRFSNLAVLGMLAILAILALPVSGQTSFDIFGGTRTVRLARPDQITGTTTNGAVDIRMFTGIVKVDLFCVTNDTLSGAITATLQTSPDTSTWTDLANYALATATDVAYTNRYYGTNGLGVTDTFLLPGTITTPTAATAGWATPYLVSARFTNSAAITVNPDNFYSVGFSVDDAQRYMRVVWTLAEGATNACVGAILTGRLHGGPGAP